MIFAQVAVIVLVFGIIWTHPDENLSTTEYIKKHGYPVEAHTYETKDGYILTSLRVPHGITSTQSKQVALLTHGMIGSAENFIFTGPPDGLAFYLADRGYDVWMLNCRGTFSSRQHRTLDPIRDAKRFWDFSFHEMGIYDLPDTIEYIEKVTGVEKIFYVGHSQGASAYFVMLSLLPRMNQKVKAAALLGPSISHQHTQSPLVYFTCRLYPLVERFLAQINWFELAIPGNPLIPHNLVKALCKPETFESTCIDILGIAMGHRMRRLNMTQMPIVFQYVLQNISVKQGAHYCQYIMTGEFKPFDNGPNKNLRLYNSPKPLPYNVSNCKVPMAIFYSPDDIFANDQMIEDLSQRVNSIVLKERIAGEEWSHIDYILAYDLRERVNEPLYKVFKQYE